MPPVQTCSDGPKQEDGSGPLLKNVTLCRTAHSAAPASLPGLYLLGLQGLVHILVHARQHVDHRAAVLGAGGGFLGGEKHLADLSEPGQAVSKVAGDDAEQEPPKASKLPVKRTNC